MKKSLWGYNVAEVEENINELEAAKAKLERQIKSLNNDLENVRGELAEEREKALTSDDNKEKEELENKYHNVMKEITALRRENTQLSQKNDVLSAQIATYDEESLKSGVEQASIICREAYEDMANAKANSKASLEVFFSEFWEKFEDYEHKISDMYFELINRNTQAKENFLLAADEILDNYNTINDSDKKLTEYINNIGSMRAEAEQGIAALIGELIDNDRFSNAEKQPVLIEEVEEKYQHSILHEISKMRKEMCDKALSEQKEDAKHEQNDEINQPATKLTAEKAVQQENNEDEDESDSSDKKYNVGVFVDVDKRKII